MTVQQTLFEFGGDQKLGSRDAMSLADATLVVTEAIRRMEPGDSFTLKGLAGSIVLRGDPRKRAVLLSLARSKGMIRSGGITRQDQEGRNSGYATLWVVQEKRFWEEEK